MCAVIGLRLLPTAAAGKPGYLKSSPGYRVQLHLRGSNGYAIRIEGSRSGSIYVIAQKRSASVAYSIADKKPGAGIAARLPGVGMVSVKFRPAGNSKQLPPPNNCRGRGRVVRHGVFVGRLRLHGERGYTEVSAQRAKGKVVHSFRQVCNNNTSHIHTAGDAHWALLSATSRRGHGVLSVHAFKLSSLRTPGLDAVSVGASTFSKRGPMLITRAVSAEADVDDLQLAEPPGSLQSASLSPPSPFTGTATFQRISKTSSTWEGPLSVELPGVGQVNLAGPEFSSSLCIDRHCTGTEDGSFVTFGRPGQ